MAELAIWIPQGICRVVGDLPCLMAQLSSTKFQPPTLYTWYQYSLEIVQVHLIPPGLDPNPNRNILEYTE